MIPSKRANPSPLFLTYENTHLYLTIKGNTYALRSLSHPVPLFQLEAPLVWIQGMMTDPQTVHLTYLKANGELSYTVIPPTGNPQTTTLDKLNVRSNRYTRPTLLVIDDKVHIFYGYSYQGIAGMWVIEHRFWDGKSWRTARLGESFHPQEPLYTIAVDQEKNIHFLCMTFQGRQSILFANRFHGVFHLWGNPIETMKLSGEVVDMTAIMTSDNIHHLFWVNKNLNGMFELRWAQRPNAADLSSTWTTAPAPIRNFEGPWKHVSIIELNGCLWLLAHAKEENLMLYEGQGWKFVSKTSSSGRPLQWTRTTAQGFQSTLWLEDQNSIHFPLFSKEIGLQNYASITPSISQLRPESPPFPDVPPTELEIQNLLTHPELSHLLEHPYFKDKYQSFHSDTFQPTASQVKISQASVSQVKLSPEPTRQEEIPILTPSQTIVPEIEEEVIPTDPESASDPESPAISESPGIPESPAAPESPVTPTLNEYITPILQSMETLGQENRSLTQMIEALLSKFDQSIQSIEKLEQQIKSWNISQTTTKDSDNKERGFFGRWFS